MRPRSSFPRRIGTLVAVLAVILSVGSSGAFARPGGGGSFSRPGGAPRPSFPSSPSRPSFPSSPSYPSSPSSPYYPSDSGGGRSSEPTLWYVLLACAVFVLIGILQKRRMEGWRQRGWSTGGGVERRRRSVNAEPEMKEKRARVEDRGQSHASVAEAIAALNGKDEELSQVLFEDFLYALYAEVQTARGRGRLDRLAPYVAEKARHAYDEYPAKAVQDIVIGAMRLEAASVTEPVRRVEVRVEWETNYTEVLESGAQQSWYVAERWVLRRSPDARSRPPERTRVFGCPNCGAPLEGLAGTTCSYCKTDVGKGDFDWQVTRIEVKERDARGPMLTGTTEEVGTDLPTVVAPDVQKQYNALRARDAALIWKGFCARVERIFDEFQVAWSSQEPMRVRPYLSDNLFQLQLYWIAAYKKAGLRNVTENARISGIHLARVVSDRHYDAITVRVYASSLDYTIDGEGAVVGGSKTRERQYSEYWTLIRGASRTGAPRTEPVCPNCGAGLDINMAGHCKHCRAKVTSGEFDWVLSRIEQDEAYG